jgi:hypothetical protein
MDRASSSKGKMDISFLCTYEEDAFTSSASPTYRQYGTAFLGVSDRKTSKSPPLGDGRLSGMEMDCMYHCPERFQRVYTSSAYEQQQYSRTPPKSLTALAGHLLQSSWRQRKKMFEVETPSKKSEVKHRMPFSTKT